MKREKLNKQILPLLLIAVALVYAVAFTVLLVPVVSNPLGDSSIGIIFLSLLIFATTVSATVAIIFYRLFEKKLRS